MLCFVRRCGRGLRRVNRPSATSRAVELDVLVCYEAASAPVGVIVASPVLPRLRRDGCRGIGSCARLATRRDLPTPLGPQGCG